MSDADSSTQPSVVDKNTADETQARVDSFKSTVNDAVEGRLPFQDFIQRLRDLGASVEEGNDYFELLQQRLEQQSKTLKESEIHEVPRRETTPEGPDEAEVIAFRTQRSQLEATARARDEEERKKAAESTGWAIFASKVSQIKPSKSKPSQSALSLEALAEFFESNCSSASLTRPASVLELAPHLASLTGAVSDDPHIEATWHLRRALASEKTLDTLTDIMQVQKVPDPISRSIWKLIAQDRCKEDILPALGNQRRTQQ